MLTRLAASGPGSSVTFVICGDSGAWPDPTADAIFAALLEQVNHLRPRPAFFVHLGDFAGPGTPERHEHYLEAIAVLEMPALEILGNHELDVHGGRATFVEIHGEPNFTFAHGHTRFVAIDGAPGVEGEMDIHGGDTPEGIAGPGEEALAFLDATLGAR